jgi:hypothetical protein
VKNPEPLASCRNCGADYHYVVPGRCLLCGIPMLRIVPEPTEPVRHLQVAKEEA